MTKKLSKLKARHTQLSDDAEANGWRSHWKEIAEFISPESGRYLMSDTEKQNKHNTGAKLHDKILNSTASDAVSILAAGLQSGLTSPSRPWFVLTTQDETLAEVDSVRQWLHDVRQQMLDVLSTSNFYSAVHTIFQELPTFSTACIFMDEDAEKLVRFRPLTIGEYLLANDNQLKAKVMYRQFVFTAYQMVEKFGVNNVPEEVRLAYENEQKDNTYEIVHVIEPNDGFTNDKRPYLSYYYVLTADKFLSESGYHSQPFAAPRWMVIGTDTYGRKGPGMKMLGDIKMLQTLEKKEIKAIDKMIDPSMNVPADMSKKAADLRPGGQNVYDPTGGSKGITPTHMVSVPIEQVSRKIMTVEERIRRGFYNDLFLAILGSDKNMTATEVVRKHEEKLLMLGPVVEALQTELLDPIIDRVFDLMLRNGILPEIPQEMSDQDIKVEYVGILAQAQKIVSTTALEQTAAFIGNLAAVKPEALDKLNVDELIDQYSNSLGTPPAIIHSDDEVAEIRAAKARAAQAAQMMQNAQVGAQAAKTLSEADTGTNNALTAIMGGG